MTEYIVKIADSNKHLLSKDDQAFLETTLSFYRNWDGDMNEESVAASLHMHYQMEFMKNLFHKYEPNDEEERMLLSDNYAF